MWYADALDVYAPLVNIVKDFIIESTNANAIANLVDDPVVIPDWLIDEAKAALAKVEHFEKNGRK